VDVKLILSGPMADLPEGASSKKSMEKTMQTTAISRYWKFAPLVLLAPTLLQLCHAQYLVGTDPTLWLDPSPTSLQVSSGTVSGWNNLGSAGSSLNLTAVGSPTTGAPLNSLNTVQLNGTSQFLKNDSVTGSSLFNVTGTTVFIVEKSDFSNPAYQSSLSWVGPNDSSSHTVLATQSTGGALLLNSGANGDTITAAAPGNVSSYHVLTFQRGTGGDPNAGLIRVDGNASVTGSFQTPAVTVNANVTGTLTLGGLTIDQGSGLAQSQLLNGNIAEVLVYKTVLNDTQIKSVETQLGSKYDLAVVPEPSQYATVFALACVLGAVAMRLRRRAAAQT
jgi:hypothetical protein